MSSLEHRCASMQTTVGLQFGRAVMPPWAVHHVALLLQALLFALMSISAVNMNLSHCLHTIA